MPQILNDTQNALLEHMQDALDAFNEKQGTEYYMYYSIYTLKDTSNPVFDHDVCLTDTEALKIFDFIKQVGQG